MYVVRRQWMFITSEAATRGVLWKNMFLEIIPNSQEDTCARVLCQCARVNIIKKETLAQVLSCEFCEISKNTFYIEHLWTTGSDSISNKRSMLNFVRNEPGN